MRHDLVPSPPAPSGRRAVVALALALLLVAACGVGEEGSPRLREDDEVPFGLLDATTTTTTPSPSTVPAGGTPICLADEDDLIVVVPRAPGSTLEERLASGPTDDEDELGLRSVLTDPAQVVGADVEDGVASIELAEDFGVATPSEQRLAIAQLVCTATRTPGVGQVAFTLGGTTLAVPTGDGALTEEPVSVDDYSDFVER